MSRQRAQHLVPPKVVAAAIELMYRSRRRCAEDLQIGPTNLAYFLSGAATLGAEKRDRLYRALGIDALDRQGAASVRDLSVREDLESLRIYLAHLGATPASKFGLVAVRRPESESQDNLATPESLFAIMSPGRAGTYESTRPTYRFRVYFRPHRLTATLSPESVSCLEWAQPAMVRLPPKLYAAWTAKKKIDRKAFDAAVSASKVTWGDFVNYFAVDLGLTVDGAFGYVEYLQAKEDAAKRREWVLNVAAQAKAKRESNDGE